MAAVLQNQVPPDKEEKLKVISIENLQTIGRNNVDVLDEEEEENPEDQDVNLLTDEDGNPLYPDEEDDILDEDDLDDEDVEDDLTEEELIESLEEREDFDDDL